MTAHAFVWRRRDLQLTDQAVFNTGMQERPVIPVYLLDDETVKHRRMVQARPRRAGLPVLVTHAGGRTARGSHHPARPAFHEPADGGSILGHARTKKIGR